MIGKKWIYSDTDRSTLHRQECEMWWQNLVWLVFISWVISYAHEWEDYSGYFWKGERFRGFGPPLLLGL